MTPKRRRGWGGAGTIDLPTSQQQQPIGRCWERVPEPHDGRREWVNPPVTLRSGSGHCRIKEDMIHTHTHTGTHKDHRLIPQHQQLTLTSNYKPCSLHFVVCAAFTVLLGDRCVKSRNLIEKGCNISPFSSLKCILCDNRLQSKK